MGGKTYLLAGCFSFFLFLPWHVIFIQSKFALVDEGDPKFLNPRHLITQSQAGRRGIWHRAPVPSCSAGQGGWDSAETRKERNGQDKRRERGEEKEEHKDRPLFFLLTQVAAKKADNLAHEAEMLGPNHFPSNFLLSPILPLVSRLFPSCFALVFRFSPRLSSACLPMFSRLSLTSFLLVCRLFRPTCLHSSPLVSYVFSTCVRVLPLRSQQQDSVGLQSEAGVVSRSSIFWHVSTKFRNPGTHCELVL